MEMLDIPTPAPPVNADFLLGPSITRTSLHWEKSAQKGKTILLQRVTWHDGHDARTLAGIVFHTAIPVEILILDDFTPPPRPMALSETMPDAGQQTAAPAKEIGNMRVILTSTAFSLQELTKNPLLRDKLPACDKDELRAAAYLQETKLPHLTLPERISESLFDRVHFACVRREDI